MAKVVYDNPLYRPGEEVTFPTLGLVLKNGEETDMAEVPAELKSDPNVTVSGGTAKKSGGDK